MTTHQLLAAVAALTVSAAASASLLTNGSFESGTFAPQGNQTMTLAPGATSIDGWVVVSDSIAWIGVGDPWGLDASDGDRFLDLSDYAAGAPFGGVRQSIATTPGTEYTVSFSLGSSSFWGRPSVLTVAAAGTSADFTSPLSGGNNDWETRSMTFLATGSTTAITFSGAAGVNYIGLDDVVVDGSVAAIPEPETVLLMLGGLGLVAARAWRRLSVGGT